ncbi:MAG: hypothetical protein P0Y49_15160 [Candidatus Pedobacter colombiensis]|uniref:Transposase (putative) YhgA-like domain-containing protein n=1 Tax=Candidatus Pedobacter colombiensis TaxID=3121371 RepID=A0AAJ5W4X9_9SPHI|nr:hypothetical protein [Pedobacter sp.]WEK18129.1 MAG: hypothetical protein P0Y49_15160 [Pedobacter sp.]
MQEETNETLPVLKGKNKAALKHRKKNDILLKGAIEDHFADVLRFFYEDADKRFDMARGFESLNKELHEIHPQLSRKGGSREADVLIKVFLLDKNSEWFLLHLEIQKIVNKNFPKRVYQYNYRLSDKYEMPIVSLAIFTGPKGQVQLNEHKTSMLGTELTFKYKVYQIFDHSEDDLLNMRSPFALVILIAQQEALASVEKIEEDNLDIIRTKIMRTLVSSKKLDTDGIRKFLYFMDKFIPIQNQQLNNKFQQELTKITGGKITMGIMEAIKIIHIQEGMEEVVENLIVKLGLTNKQTADIANVTMSFVKNVRKEIEAKKQQHMLQQISSINNSKIK